ncbi:MAG: glucan biosynthesis protein D [Nevskiaceae bacterium]|nr:MAG: glucan biosynthesis protein D [Nevskiaceae bacterium]TBR74636.1 MAG: glucan biosynthesis protein D [Nevskiaceae bacterium]
MDRRTFLAGGATLASAALGMTVPAMGADGLRYGPEQAFSFDGLMAQAEALARAPYVPPSTAFKGILDQLDYQAYGKIHFNSDDALFAHGPGDFPVTFFHLGQFFQVPVHLYAVSSAGRKGAEAREILYSPAYFDMPADSPARKLPSDAGFAGFRFQESRLGNQKEKPWRKNDWVAFLGASYFRAIGALYQYGLSARGIAVNTAVAGVSEEFPNFTHFYIETPTGNNPTVTVCALLDGPSVTGAYRFTMTRNKAVLMDIDAAVYLRRDVQRLGIAPLTSMYWFSETVKPTAIDWRPEVHDSDGLALWTGAGEHIWRPLDNPPSASAAAFMDENPHGFGLCQRDRNFDHYLDGVYYDRRPTLWVEPLAGWGKGSVQLIELPTDDEINDNVVAMWVPESPAKAGSRYRMKYRLHWVADEPFPSPLSRCQATRIGRGGQPGKPRPDGVRKFVVEFSGGPLKTLPKGVFPEVVITATRGKLSWIFTEPVPDGVAGHWRAFFDLAVDGKDPVDLRLYLKHDDRPLSETWLYTWHPI